MRSAVILAAIAGLATANPVPNAGASSQNGIDLSVFDEEPKPTKIGPAVGATLEKPTYNPGKAAAAAASDAIDDPVILAKRSLVTRASTCTNPKREPDGYGPVPSPDNYETWSAWSQPDTIANGAKVPDGYEKVFNAKSGSVEGPGYQGLYTLQKYDPIKCQQLCDAAPACYGFNLFLERNPKFTPTDTCIDPESITNYKCTLWGAGVTEASATNVGQWRNQFHVGIRGSNGYNKVAGPPVLPGFDGPFAYGGAIQAPRSYIGAKYYPGVYDPAQCAEACKGTTKYDHDHPRSDGTYDACNFFNAYVLSENYAPQGTYCGLYTESWDKKYSTNVGQYRGDDYYSVSRSYGYSLNPKDSGRISAD